MPISQSLSFCNAIYFECTLGTQIKNFQTIYNLYGFLFGAQFSTMSEGPLWQPLYCMD